MKIDYKCINEYINENHPELKSTGKLYVLCSDKFKNNPVYACMQGGRAIAGYMKEVINLYYECDCEDVDYWRDGEIVFLWYSHDYLNVNKSTIRPTEYISDPFATNSVSCKGVPVYCWHEPKENNEITAMVFSEDDLMNIENHDPYWWGKTLDDAVHELSWCKKDIDELEPIKY